MNEPKYLIWSNQHSAWWRNEGRGYTAIISEAGRFSREQAIDIAGGHRAWTKGGIPDEIPALEQDAIDCGAE